MNQPKKPILLTCDCCGKEESYEGQFFVGQNPYRVAMAIDEDDVPDDEVLCEDCHEIAVGDI